MTVAHGWFTRIHQVPTVCTPSTPQLASALYRCCSLLSRFEYVNLWTYLGMSGVGPFSPSKLPLHMADLDPSNTCFLCPTGLNILNGITIGSAIFVQLIAESPYILQWAAPFPLKILASPEASGSHLTHGSLGPRESNPKWNLFRSI